MYRDNDILVYETLVRESKELFPYHYFLTTVFESWDIVDRLGKDIHEIALTDSKILARYSKSHLYPLIGVNTDRKRNCHYHNVLLSEKPLNFQALSKFEDGRRMDIKEYDGRRECLVYTGRKHIPFYQRHIIHPRFNRSECQSHTCSHSRCLAPHIPT